MMEETNDVWCVGARMLDALQHTWASPSQGWVAPPHTSQVLLLLHFYNRGD